MQVKNSKFKIQNSKLPLETQKSKVMRKRKTIAKKTNELTAPVYDTEGKKAGEVALPKEIFAVKVNKQLIAQAVRVHLANVRRGTASTKTRGQVQGSSRKIYRQKGTGRARHGSIRAPIFVHGGIVFGPKPRSFTLDFPKKMRRQALFATLSAKFTEESFKVVRGLGELPPKTKEMARVLHNLAIANNLLLVLPSPLTEVTRAARNIKGVKLTLVSQLSAYDVWVARTLLFMQEALPLLTTTFLKEKKEV